MAWKPDDPKQNFIQSLWSGAKNLGKKIIHGDVQNYIVTPGPQQASAYSASSTQGVAPLKPYSFDRDDFRNRISYNETRGQKDPYRTVGVTNDLGRYQVSPDTLEAWSEPWLGKQYDQESFLADPDAQDRFFEEYMNVAESYQLNPEEAAIAWHRGWGELGTGEPRNVREKKFKTRLQQDLTDPASLAYLTTFRNYGQ